MSKPKPTLRQDKEPSPDSASETEASQRERKLIPTSAPILLLTPIRTPILKGDLSHFPVQHQSQHFLRSGRRSRLRFRQPLRCRLRLKARSPKAKLMFRPPKNCANSDADPNTDLTPSLTLFLTPSIPNPLPKTKLHAFRRSRP